MDYKIYQLENGKLYECFGGRKLEILKLLFLFDFKVSLELK